MTNKSDIINELIKENNVTKYLELGFGDGANFKRINAKEKTSVDINGKADFNDGDLDFLKVNNIDYECVFIDSEHIASHVRKVLIEVLKMSPKLIILHDTLPKSKAMQEVPRNTKEWTGDVWRAVVGFKQSYPEVKLETYRADYGLSVIYPEGKKVKKNFENKEMSFGDFKSNEVELLNIIAD